MRNIALLEWGPASLYYLHPREKIKVRTPWLDGGPLLPSFLSTMEETKNSHSPEIKVRYALSGHGDLNGTIKNLRNCFGFPYPEYIGYLNTLNWSYRARREHEWLIERLRKWAIHGNVDAVVWIDYAKPNQPTGSFKLGPLDSRPFSVQHIQMWVDDEGGANVDEESDTTWSDIENESSPGVDRKESKILTHAQETASTIFKRRSVKAATGILCPIRRVSGTARAAFRRVKRTDSSTPRTMPESPSDKDAMKGLLQEEVIPVHGCIYPRSIVPGPGYYSVCTSSFDDSKRGSRFSSRGMKTLFTIHTKDNPGPGQYTTMVSIGAESGRLGSFCKEPRMVESRKLPFISDYAAEREQLMTNGPDVFYTVTAPDTIPPGRGPNYSFSKCRRPHGLRNERLSGTKSDA